MAIIDLNPENVDIQTGAKIKDDKHEKEQKEPVLDAGQDKPDKEAGSTT